MRSFSSASRPRELGATPSGRGPDNWKMLGRHFPVRADVAWVALSSHADQSDLLDWARSASPAPRMIYVNHGEPDASAALRRGLGSGSATSAVAPRPANVCGSTRDPAATSVAADGAPHTRASRARHGLSSTAQRNLRRLTAARADAGSAERACGVSDSPSAGTDVGSSGRTVPCDAHCRRGLAGCCHSPVVVSGRLPPRVMPVCNGAHHVIVVPSLLHHHHLVGF